MSSFYVEVIGAETFKQAEKMLADVPGGMDRALKSATKRAVSFLRTQSTKEIRQRYDLTRKNIRAEQNIRVSYRYFNGIEARITFRGNKIPLFRYGGSSPKTPTVNPDKTIMAIVNGNLRPVHPGVAAAGHQLVSTSPTTFSRAFVAQMKSGHIGIFERTGGKHQPATQKSENSWVLLFRRCSEMKKFRRVLLKRQWRKWMNAWSMR